MQTSDIQELSIILAAPNHNPTLLNPDFLGGSGIVPLDWELARQPVINNQTSQVAFTNGVNFVAQPGSIIFSEAIGTKPLSELNIATVAAKYATTLPNLDYRAVSISPKRFATFNNQPDAVQQFITSKLLAPGAWREFGTAPLQATLTLAYTLEERQLILNIAEARLQLPEQEALPAILFAGNFQYALPEIAGEARLQKLYQCIDNWQRDWSTFQELLETKFMAPAKVDRDLLVPIAAPPAPPTIAKNA